MCVGPLELAPSEFWGLEHPAEIWMIAGAKMPDAFKDETEKYDRLFDLLEG